MLIQFAAQNFRSIQHRVELSMRISEFVEAEDDHQLIADIGTHVRLLRCAAVYGANASGKSNLVEAMDFAKGIVVDPPAPKDATISVPTFRLNHEAQSQPATFEFYIFASGTMYGYEFSLTDREVVSERLSVVPADNPNAERELYSRKRKSFSFSEEFRHTTEDAKFLEYVAKGTRANQLFLNEAHERGVGSIEPIFRWFASSLVIIGPDAEYLDLARAIERERTFREFLQDILAWADTGIVGIDVKRNLVEERTMKVVQSLRKNKKIQPLLRAARRRRDNRDAFIEHDDGRAETLSVRCQHRTAESVENFELPEESDGTVRLLDLAPMLYLTKTHAPVYVVDELDRSLHTLLAQRLVERFITETGKAPGTLPLPQLIFTTHDTNLLDCRRLRPDCIWFAEKDALGASSFYSLAEFEPAQLQSLCGDIEKGYLRGRFGGIPFLGDPEKLNWLKRLPKREA